ncbi:hypothetical protein [Spirulina sp. 06S082]|uniref:hypothetical protein n=1 Tax=Spirulina sp. 06S082 TaxID=3110248 RepID=UPI002B21C399|nr:hypothetical protein [Spirulina sp. 06S082]MEA5467984.1 hypothetical protein [Spirulina sp. 06S082]
MSAYYSEGTINQWISSLTSLKTAGQNVMNFALKDDNHPTIHAYEVQKGGSIKDANSELTQIRQQFGNTLIIRAKQIVQYNKYYNATNNCNHAIFSLNSALQNNKVKDLVIINNNILSFLNNLLNSFSQLPTGGGHEVVLYYIDGGGKAPCISYSQDFRNPLFKNFIFSHFVLKGIVPTYTNSAFLNHGINLDATENPPDDIPSTAINLKDEGARKLIDNIGKNRTINDDSSVISVNNQYSNTINSQDILDELSLMSDSNNKILSQTSAIVENMNVRFRNVSLTEDEDDVFNLSTWLFAFQKQVMYIIYEQLLNISFENKSTGETESFDLKWWLFAFQKQMTGTLYEQLTNISFENISTGQIENFNLKWWLFAFQKQVMSTQYDIKDVSNTISENQNDLIDKIDILTENQNVLIENQTIIMNKQADLNTRLDALEISLSSITQQLAIIHNRVVTIQNIVDD